MVMVLRRFALMCQPGPEDAVPPPARLLLGEVPWLHHLLPGRGRMGAVPLAARPQNVMLLPGFLAHTAMMRSLQGSLAAAGHGVEDWGLGFNFGPTEENLVRLRGGIEDMAARAGAPVALVGWSLGGIFAREVAKLVPDAVAHVITLGAPFSGNRRANHAWRLYQFVTGHDVDHPPMVGDLAEKPPVPTTAIWSGRDGIVAPASARGLPAERDHAIEVASTHMQLPSDPATVRAVLTALDRGA